ncbi:MAG TPA: hypothetical protein VL098_06370 [Flavipsychrobacter sp.]|nr:hypothetical protein [Flavipsychrobacter sp.]
MKIKLLFIFLLWGQIAFGQTEKLTKVAGTKCSLILPTGFVTATTFSGFQNPEWGASIMVNELPTPYLPLAEGFTAEALKTKGMILVSKEAIDFNGSKATLINVTQPTGGMVYIKQILIFGDSRNSVLVNGVYPETSKEIATKIKEALLSTVYDSSQQGNALDAVPFTLDVKDTDFKLAKYLSGSLLYSTDGKIPTEKPMLIAGNSIAKVTAHNQKEYAEERLKKLPGGNLTRVKEINEITVDNLKGYEIIADRKTKNDKSELLYQVMLFNDKGDYYIIVGQTLENFDISLDAFRKVAKTFKRK